MTEAVASRSLTADPADPAVPASRRVFSIVGMLGAVFLGGVLLFAAWAKAIHPTAFVEEIAARGLTLGVGAATVAYLALALEAGLGTLLLLDVRRLWVLVPAALLVAFFLALTGQDYLRDLRGLEPAAASCGCFGNLVARTPAQAFWGDLMLLVPPLGLAFLGRLPGARRIPPVRTAVAVAVAVGAVVLAWKAPALPLDDLATRLKPGVAVADVCAGEGSERVCMDSIVPELVESGPEPQLVILATLDEAFGEQIPAINAYVDAQLLAPPDTELPALHVVTTTGPEERQAFFWQWAPGFEARQAPEAMMAPLYRRLPRSFLVADGTVRETYDGLPPFARWAGDSLSQAPETIR